MATESTGVRGRVSSTAASVFDRREGSVLVGLIAIFLVGVYIDASRFLLLDNMARILRSAATTAIIGYGVALLMVTAEFDLSVGSMYGVAAGMGAILVGGDAFGFHPLFALAVILVFALIFGITQGLVVTKMELPSLIVTIGTLTLLRGVHRILLGGTTASASEVGLLKWLGGPIIIADLPFVNGPIRYQVPFLHDQVHSFGQFSILIVWIFVLLGLFHYILNYTRFGRHARATGDNIESVETTGVDPEMVKLGCFGLCSLTAAFAGLAFLGRFGSVSSGSGDGLALVVIAAVVLGGTKLTGGEGSMVGVLFGALVLATANNVLALAGLNVSGWQGVITGGFIIAAIGLDVILKGFSYDLLESWYATPMRNLLASPREFFATNAEQKTTDDTFGFLMLTVGVAAVATNVLAWILGTEAVSGALGLPVEDFKLFLLGGWPETVAQIYFFLMLMTLLAAAAVAVATQYFDSRGDYEDALVAVCYGMAAAPLFAVPTVLLGFGIFFVVSPMVSALLAAVPVVLLIGWTMAAGVTETHDLSRGRAFAVVGAVYLVWVVAAGVVALGLSTA
ncbi:ABC transporter integral membrane protein [Halosimplex carlsbadense 2-9-1]|uniref:ABC transporter integral membrane protein n=1 Tax=Halosimplex carlsbadense 2-9-1 TaxID=797114 RepID=M0D7Z6_9EURY|nr:ABC transporter permease [Halosimplex carlsbadense]ELZ30279.1 ABC transporter integral membrane protein [Halosimplex carlsbadense 2-9-1]